MSVSCSTLYQDVCGETGAGGGSTRLARDFVRAVNRSLDELSHAADLASEHSHITKTSDTVTTLDSDYEYILYHGVLFHLFRMGHKPRDPRIAAAAYKDTADRWSDGKDDYVVAEDNSTQSDSTAAIAKLGVPSTT